MMGFPAPLSRSEHFRQVECETKRGSDSLAGNRPSGTPIDYRDRRREAIMAHPYDRFISKVRIDLETGCHVWMAATTNGGYGKIFIRKVAGRSTFALAHRWSYEYHVGPIPDGLVIDHLCYNTRCVNPEHLEAVTVTENVRRIRRHLCKRPPPKMLCKQGHDLVGDNVYREPKGGKRHCLTCRRRRSREYARAKASRRSA